MAKRMLIDAAHPEETRVVVLNGNRLEEFDFETSTKRQIKGNIYLAKITRVEPSLQAAFVEYGGNRHGFLAFNEIHPDYYRIPVADRQAALEAERVAEHAANAREDAERDAAAEQHETDAQDAEQGGEFGGFGPEDEPFPEDDGDGDSEPDEDRGAQAGREPASSEDEGEPEADRMAHEAPAETIREPQSAEPLTADAARDERSFPEDPEFDRFAEPADSGAHDPESPRAEESGHFYGDANDEPQPETVAALAEGTREDRLDEAHLEAIETVGGDELEEATRPRARPFRHYKIQEVIKRRQIMLVQVVKEERGNKGAALTTYLSLAGRYCVLMPNTPRGGGVSRKITNTMDRRRLKELMSDLNVPDGMGVIVRTAGSERSKTEIKRDFEYLLRLWDEIRDLTLRSTAPALIYEEGNLIKRSIRDLYARDIDEVVVDGDEGYRTAKSFMKMLMPSHAKRVKPYRDPSVPLFHRYQIEAQIDAIHSPIVQLRSGGYIVINPTEALVAIDVNSGRSTKERNIEETALKTNLEAAEEIARQLRLRDLAGLIVIDYIDMEEYRNRGSVERRLKEAMRYDRARIQLGRISPFGLLELSRQRLRPSLVEASTQPCPYCNGSGHIRSIESAALHVLRAIEEEGMRRRSAEVAVTVSSKVALYVLNQKRTALQQAEARFGFHVAVGSDDTLIPPAFRLDRMRALTPAELAALPSLALPPPEPEDEDEDDSDDISPEDAELGEGGPDLPSERPADEGHDQGRRRRRRHNGRRDDRERPQQRPVPEHAEPRREGSEDEPLAAASFEPQAHEPRAIQQGESASDAERRRRRRGRRGGRRRQRNGERPADHRAAPQQASEGNPLNGADPGPDLQPDIQIDIGDTVPEAVSIELVAPAASDTTPQDIASAYAVAAETQIDIASVPVAEATEDAAETDRPLPPAEATTPAEPPPPPRRGWWRR
ncbi:MAG TPA: Rne/Rng family ribonuclease [Stellaceae bacterium]|nr:Rne/Rng family ribonuclease [Stellaceae bacterium]